MQLDILWRKLFFGFSTFSVFCLNFADFKHFWQAKACIRYPSAICIFHSHLLECRSSFFYGLQQGTTSQYPKICEKRPFSPVWGPLDPLNLISASRRYPSPIPMNNAHLLVYWLTSFFGEQRRTRIYKVATSVFLWFLCIFRGIKDKRIFFFHSENIRIDPNHFGN